MAVNRWNSTKSTRYRTSKLPLAGEKDALIGDEDVVEYRQCFEHLALRWKRPFKRVARDRTVGAGD